MRTFIKVVFLLVSVTGVEAATVEKVTDVSDQNSVAITIYNKNLALVKDQRSVQLDKGFNQLAFRGVSAKIRSETALLRSLNHAADFYVIEQNFDYDLLSPSKLLDKYVGRKLRIARTHPVTGKQKVESATVLSTENGVVVKIGDRIEINPQGQFIFDAIPKNLRDKPTLVTQLNSSTARKQQLELSYLTSGLSWQADYIAELNAAETSLNLLGWVTLNNSSGTDYTQAKLQLVAGDVHQVQRRNQPRYQVAKRSLERYSSAPNMQEENLFEYHLYHLNRRTNILNQQTKQVSLLSANSIPVQKTLVLQGESYYYHNRVRNFSRNLKIGVFIQFDNKRASKLGMPIPKGIVRVYKKDSRASAQFVGEDRISHTPKNAVIRLKLGDSFDVTAGKKQTDFKKNTAVLGGVKNEESAFEIELKNAKNKEVTVVVREPISGDWEILAENVAHKKISSSLVEWQIKIPAESSTRLSYRVLVK